MSLLKQQHALVTGAATGIGAAVARKLYEQGAMLTLVGRRRDRLDALRSELRDAFVSPADVTSRSDVDSCFAEARRANGPITILVNNAGAAESAPFAKVTEASWRRSMALNLDALLHCTQAALPDLLAAPAGRLVTIASTAGLRGYSYVVPYAAAKHGAVGFTRAMATEFARTNLTANAVCPGFTDTPLIEDAVANICSKTGCSPDEARAELVKLNPQGRLIKPEEVANAVLWLCLPESGSVTGQAIAVAGGEVM